LLLQLHSGASDEQFNEALEAILQSEALERSRQLAEQYAYKAKSIIEYFEDHPGKQDLQVLAAYFLK